MAGWSGRARRVGLLIAAVLAVACGGPDGIGSFRSIGSGAQNKPDVSARS